MDDLIKTLDGWIHEAAALLSRNYETYWPKRGQADPNERDLTTSLAAVIADNPDCFIFTEVPIDRSSGDRIDLVVLVPGMDACFLIESKNVESSKMRRQVISDFRKMHRFGPKPALRDGSPFPRRVLIVALMMGWTGSDHPSNPLEKPCFHNLSKSASKSSQAFRKCYAEVPRTHLEEPYSHQWLMCFIEGD